MADGDGRPDGRDVAAQLPLLPAGDDGGAALRRAVEGPRGPGRPAGSPNKRTEATVAYMLQRYRSPLEALAAVYSMPLGDLARELAPLVQGSGRPTWSQILDLLRLQVAAAKELAPYLHQKQPTAIEVDAAGAIPIGIFLSREAAAGLEHALSGERLTIDATLSESEQNQGVGEADPAELDSGELDNG